MKPVCGPAEVEFIGERQEGADLPQLDLLDHEVKLIDSWSDQALFQNRSPCMLKG